MIRFLNLKVSPSLDVKWERSERIMQWFPFLEFLLKLILSNKFSFLSVGEPDDDDDEDEESVLKGALYLLAGGILIVLFSSPFISSVVEVATFWNFSPTLLAFFLAPVASEAPEILESISLSRKGNVQNINIAISNMVGGTITKTTLLCGVCFF